MVASCSENGIVGYDWRIKDPEAMLREWREKPDDFENYPLDQSFAVWCVRPLKRRQEFIYVTRERYERDCPRS
jgi:hypothetical protein